MIRVNYGKGRGTKTSMSGHRFDHVVACSGTIECGPGHAEAPKSEPVWQEDALAKMRAHYQAQEKLCSCGETAPYICSCCDGPCCEETQLIPGSLKVAICCACFGASLC